jgi:hypothetical protein
MKKNNLIISLSLALMIFAVSTSVAQATESAWQNLNPSFESGLSGNVHNCVPLTVSNGTVAAYPGCAITCNAGYSLSGSSCVAQSSSSGGGGGGGSTVYCSVVTYSDWQTTCASGVQLRTVLTSAPSGCTLTSAQQIAVQRTCTVDQPNQEPPVPTLYNPSQSGVTGVGLFRPRQTSSVQPTPNKPTEPVKPAPVVLGAKVYANFTALKDSKTGKIYVIYNGGKYQIKNLKELALYRVTKTIKVDTAVLNTYKNLAKYPVAPKSTKKK